MSEKAARTHNYGSNRVKHREIGEKKTVFKSVLDNPFRIQWPSVPLNVQNSVLAHVIDILNGVADYQHTRSKANRKRKRGEQGEPMKRKKPDDTNKKTLAMDLSETASSTALSLTISSDKTSLERPPTILEHLVVGINQVTKRLETQIRDKRITILTAADGSNMGLIQPPLQVIFVCRADIDPPLLIDHLPHLVAAYNSVQTTNTLKIVSLPKGAESALAQAVGLRRAGVIGIDIQWPKMQMLVDLLSAVATLNATWLASAAPYHRLVPTHIKQLQTSAPKDMKVEKERRKEGKALAKVAQKEKSDLKTAESQFGVHCSKP